VAFCGGKAIGEWQVSAALRAGRDLIMAAALQMPDLEVLQEQ
jgi:hypothetical protein